MKNKENLISYRRMVAMVAAGALGVLALDFVIDLIIKSLFL